MVITATLQRICELVIPGLQLPQVVLWLGPGLSAVSTLAAHFLAAAITQVGIRNVKQF